MGKVKSLRKKYRTLCVKTKAAQNEASATLSQVPYNADSSGSNPDIDFLLKVASKKSDFDVKSTCSISKSIKSCISGIQKKDKQRLRHELFLKRLDATKQELSNLKKPKKKHEKKIDLKDNLPLISSSIKEQGELISKVASKKKQINVNSNQKGISKIRQKRLIEDLSLFKKTLSDKSFKNDPQDTVKNRTLEMLSQEFFQTSN